MRLINVHTLRLEEFHGKPPSYAILSHRWRDEELSLQDFSNEIKRVKMAGFPKIRNACIEARGESIDYVWIDTCCIDKTSSAELSEAINSMFRWYAESMVCYAFLDDVGGIDDLGASIWFTRGWTLQELIAPREVRFYVAVSDSWRCIGTKAGLTEKLQHITGIASDTLQGGDLRDVSIAKRMSWASK